MGDRRSLIASSADKSKDLSEFEFGMIIVTNAFNRWAIRCMAAAGVKDLTILDVLLLHHVNHRAKEKKVADIAFLLNVEDTHTVSYSLKKLTALGLVKGQKRGKEVLFSTTAAGQDAIARYRDVRQRFLISATSKDVGDFEVGELTRLLRVLSAMYDQAARAAASM